MIDTNTRLASSTTGLSFSIFFNDRGDNGGDQGSDSVVRLLSSYSGPGSPPNQLDFSLFGNRQFVLFAEGVNQFSTAQLPFQDGLWHQAGFVFDSGTLTFYFDGVQSGDQITFGSSTIAEQLNNWSLLNTTTQFGDEYFDGGDYDEAALWNRALSSAEMQAIYSQGLATAVPEPSAFSFVMLSLASSIIIRRRKATTSDCRTKR